MDDFFVNIDNEFKPTEQQKEAIEFPEFEPLKIVAGAGTGKTTVLSYRYLYLVKKKNMSPENILALTFTKKAAYNLKQKVSEILNDDYVMLKANIYNFDSLWLKLILDYPNLSGLDRDFRIMDNTEKGILRENIIYEMTAGIDKDFIMNLKYVNLTDIKRILNEGFIIISNAKTKLINEEPFEQIVLERIEYNREKFEKDNNYQIQIEYAKLFSRLYKNYQKKIIEEKVLDFDDVLIKAYCLLKNYPAIAEKYKRKFKYILIDEIQDTSYGQLEILKLLSKDNFKNVTVVGDDKQSIFGWRDAEIENIRTFPGKKIFLNKNRRSYNEILEFANFTIFLDPLFEKNKKLLELENDVKGYKNSIAVKMFCAENGEQEAKFAANEIIKLNNNGVSLNDIAVLSRKKENFKIFEKVFRDKEIPFNNTGGGYYENEEIKDIIAYLKIIDNPFDISALVRILENSPYPLNLDSMMKIGSIIKKLSGDGEVNIFVIFKEILSNPEISDFTKKKVLTLNTLLEDFNIKKDKLPLPNLIYSLLDENKYLKMLYAGEYSIIKNKVNILKSIYFISQQYEKKFEKSTVSEFVKYLEYKMKVGWDDDELFDETDEEKVVFLTIHKSKGLEFDYVFCSNIEIKKRSNKPRILFDLERKISDGKEIFSGYGLVLRYKNDINRDNKDETEIFKKAIEQTNFIEKQKTEEIRLNYVELTRAREMLFLTTVIKKGKPSEYYKMLIEEFGKKDYVEIITEPEESNIKINLSKKDESDKISLEEKVEKILKEYKQKDEKIPILPGKKILKLDFSMLKNYNHCPLKYKYIFEYKFPINRISLTGKETEKSGSEDSDNKLNRLIFGICIHKVLENYYYWEETHELFLEKLMIGYGIKETDYKKKFEERGKAVFNNFRKFNLDKSTPVYTEKEFNLWFSGFENCDIHFKGFIDRIDKRNDCWEIADYKTGFKGSTINLEDDVTQMQIYDLAVNENVFEDVKNPDLMIYFLEEGKSRKVNRNLEIRDYILSTAENIIEKRFDVDEEIHKDRDCWNCEFGGITGFCNKNLVLSGKKANVIYYATAKSLNNNP